MYIYLFKYKCIIYIFIFTKFPRAESRRVRLRIFFKINFSAIVRYFFIIIVYYDVYYIRKRTTNIIFINRFIALVVKL